MPRPALPTTLAAAVGLSALLASTALTPAASATTTIRGTVRAGSGYTVVGVPRNGAGPSARLSSSRSTFTLRFSGRSARGATLQLVGPHGSYYGPVRLGGVRGRAYTHLSGRSGNLGRLELRGGYATPARRIAAKLIDTRIVTRANARGKPVGAGRLGLVPARTTGRASAAAPMDPALGADPDADGVPNSLDIDDNGNGNLDATDPASGPPQNRLARVFTNLKVSLEDSLNLDAGSVPPAQLDALLVKALWPAFEVNGSALGSPITAVNVDCFQLAYCRPGDGTATVFAQPGATTPPGDSPWVAYDPDADGLPNLTPGRDPSRGSWGIGILSHVPGSQISPSDTLNFKISTATAQTVTAATMGAYFVTTPAIASYDDGSGPRTIAYPPQPGDPGTAGGRSDIQLASGKVTLTFWRPQRRAIAGAETGGYVDMGRLHYMVSPPGGTGACSSADLSNPSPTLRPGTDGYYDWLTDGSADAAPASANTLSFTVDLGQCLRRQGLAPEQCGALGLEARTDASDNAAQSIWVRMPGAVCRAPGVQ